MAFMQNLTAQGRWLHTAMDLLAIGATTSPTHNQIKEWRVLMMTYKYRSQRKAAYLGILSLERSLAIVK